MHPQHGHIGRSANAQVTESRRLIACAGSQVDFPIAA